MINFDELNNLADQARTELQAAADAKSLEDYRIRFFSKKGLITQARSLIGKVAAEDRAAFGKAVNDLAKSAEEAFKAKQADLGSAAAKVSGPVFDVTLPGTHPPVGRPHVLTQTIWELSDIFGRMGFEVIDAPEVEDEWHNFQALNIPLDHPARDPLENFYINSAEQNTLLRSQTSTAQIRIMEQRTPPVRVVHVGRVYRPDTIDAKHHMMFHQIESLYVDKGVSMIDLKSTIDQYLKAYFGPDARIRLRPSYFPFTEPSAEVDTTCMICHGKGCNCCNGGWMEIGGCGMVDPNVLRAVGYDPEVYSGFAFGFGIERMAMRKHDIKDIRLFTENDVRFLQQF
jgi:phenylalanyl-tRNA synthetase alpha chain